MSNYAIEDIKRVEQRFANQGITFEWVERKTFWENSDGEEWVETFEDVNAIIFPPDTSNYLVVKALNILDTLAFNGWDGERVPKVLEDGSTYVSLPFA